MRYQLATLSNLSHDGKYFSSSALPAGCVIEAADSLRPVGSSPQSKLDMMNSWAWSLALMLALAVTILAKAEAQGGVLRINRHWDGINTVLPLQKHVEHSGFITLEGRDALRKTPVDR